MGTKGITKRIASACLVATALFLSACSSEGADNAFVKNVDTVVTEAQTSQAAEPFTLVLTAMSNGKDVTTTGKERNVSLFVFDQANEYVKTVNVSTYELQNKRTISIDAPKADAITVVAYAGLSAAEQVSSAKLISDLQVTLKESNGITSTPSDLFYGKVSINRNQTKAGAQQLVIDRKTTSLFVRMTGVESTSDDDFYYIVKQTKNTLKSNGEYEGGDVSYVVAAKRTANGNITTENFPVLATSLVEVSLYKNDELVYSATNLQNNADLALNAGGQVKVTFDTTKTASVKVATGDYDANIIEL